MTAGWLHVVLDVPAAEPTGGFWATALGWPLGGPWPDHPELRSFSPPDGDAYVHLQQVDGPAGRHLDLEVDDVDAEHARLLALGATDVRRTADWWTVRSPGGLELCLLAARPRTRPAPVTGPSGTRRRLVQVCLDLPPRLVDVDAAFWRAALAWREVPVDDPEFLGRLVPSPGHPLQVLLQRLDDDDGGPTRLHLDLGSEDLAADVTLLQDRGAAPLHEGDGFVALRDPAGQVFCVTRNAPDAP
ncbi:hypothetical protein SAMN04488543_1016 [Friedmanniella luteola]|uniref:VOC domain-containing protein n=1 Tax=Friedmanniella luteola TaxID=546871 RepID=A0A1H1P8E4_9ACTN|nr:VOC family protein [Friedmanniella luteola]SDS07424.1 hypothetical protein SAMN04488543_1016 [Friedmanniella luteola]